MRALEEEVSAHDKTALAQLDLFESIARDLSDLSEAHPEGVLPRG